MGQEHDREDRELVRSVVDGDTNAFAAIVGRYKPLITSIGRRLIRSSADVPDFVQEVFLKAYAHLWQFTGTGRFFSWLVRIAYTTAANCVQRAAPEVATDPFVLESLPHAPAERDPERRMLRVAAVETLSHAISRLPRHFARAVRLSALRELGYADIEKITGLSQNTLKSHVFRARKLLRERLAGTVAAEPLDL
jgi:RNA polymerase sigma-70 factor (ECF subfamily)